MVLLPEASPGKVPISVYAHVTSPTRRSQAYIRLEQTQQLTMIIGRFGQGLRMSVIFSLASTLPVAEAYPGQIQIESAQRGFLSLSAFMLAPFVFAYGNRRTVSGCLMGTSCFTWMTVKADPSAGITVTWRCVCLP